ncbi:tetratricopeptide repeat protein [Desulfosporosinus youngiae]|uniref:Tetratricopeptide repeat protein n=1 Tax=Desulfosporosinus youngiae DSM 17734 TaxID=768710 RepID=H5Y554_9FIRM|nr:hypothetical protein [Desulfosporosinus youngiae]EHQ90158.1 hypothetical protein DesyoDRAFT_3122 [Desulfosporosinus youngiae DSM 17734]
MIKRRKRGYRSRRKAVFLLLLVIIFLFTAGPFVWHMEKIRQAKSIYDIPKVQEELLWVETNAGLLNKLGFVKDTKLWLELNVGGQDLESKLVSYQDEKHRFWLYLLYLQEGKLTDARNVLDSMSESSLKGLGEGLMLISKGDAGQARQLLAETGFKWKELSVEEQILGHLSLAQAALILGDPQGAQTELQAAQELNPHNPAYLSMAFNMAIEQEQWTKAVELSQRIDTQTWRQGNGLYETKKAILAIRQDNSQALSESLSSLQELPQGEACINYVNGIQALGQGKLEEGKKLLTEALAKGLEGELNSDAQKALNQVIDREKAEQKLRAVVAETS